MLYVRFSKFHSLDGATPKYRLSAAEKDATEE